MQLPLFKHRSTQARRDRDWVLISPLILNRCVHLAAWLGFCTGSQPRVFVFFLLWLVASAGADPAPPLAMVKAPPLRDCQSIEQRDLGKWDDVFILEDEDLMVLRRGNALFDLSMLASEPPRELAHAPILATSKIVAGVKSDDKLWLFIQSKDSAPFAIEANSGKVVMFDIPALKIPGSHAPEVQSCVIVPRLHAAVLMVAGGDRETWPRPGNRPVFFWISLESGKVFNAPIGWDLTYFSQNLDVAVFDKPQDSNSGRRPLQSIDVRTGELLSEAFDRLNTSVVSFAWTDTPAAIKPLYLRRREKGDRDYLSGLVVDGVPYPFELDLDREYYLESARANDRYAGFRLRPSGGGGQPSPLWLVDLSQGMKPQPIVDGVTDFQMLNAGKCVFSTSGHGHRGHSSEVFCLTQDEKSSWNVLEGVERLPALEKELAGNESIEDQLSVRMIKSFGKGRSHQLVLCLFSQYRNDHREFSSTAGRHVDRALWQRAMILGGDGQRYLTDILREGKFPDRISVHHSGKIIMENDIWQESGSNRMRRVQLSETTLRLQP